MVVHRRPNRLKISLKKTKYPVLPTADKIFSPKVLGLSRSNKSRCQESPLLQEWEMDFSEGVPERMLEQLVLVSNSEVIGHHRPHRPINDSILFQRE